MPVALTVSLTAGEKTSEGYFSKETMYVYVLQIIQEQLSVYFEYASDRLLGEFYRNGLF